jgi:ubiquinone/menaquinone biosynthesis C-methylase UbiE
MDDAQLPVEQEIDEKQRLTDVFFDVLHGLPRQGIGSDEQTLRALALCEDLPDKPDVLDIGCGPGMQTVALAKALDARITAVDLHDEFLDELRARADAAGVRDRIGIMRADMAYVPFGADSFDLIWCEGAAYIMGVTEALLAWQRPLRRSGYVALSEIVWTQPDPPAEVLEFHGGAYQGMTDIEGNLERFRVTGYDVVGHFLLPEACWWDDYYDPLEAKLPALFEKYAGDEPALEIVESTRREIELRRRYPDAFGYAFFVGRPADPDRPSG